jgi:glycosyltransferase involved in cell wall biosynthesis
MTSSPEVSPPEVSVVIACRNEQDNAEAIAAAVIAQLEPIVESFDIIFIDNESQDRTVAIVKGMCARDPRIKLIVNTRNYGQMRSPTHGIYQAGGRAIISMCADFQDSPDLLPEFVRRWRAGTDIVLGVRESEKSGAALTFMRELSYSLQQRFGDYPIIPNATGFGIYDRRVVEAIRALNEPHPFFRGLLVETGFSIETIPFKRPERAGGKSNNNFFTLLDFALNGLAGSSKNLLRAPLYVAFFIGILTTICLLGAVYATFTGRSVQLWLFAAMLEGQFCMLFLFLGLLGVQMGLVSDRTRNQPLVLERERINFPPGYRP